jgi:hypothetical protein
MADVRFSVGAKDIFVSLLHNVQTGPGADSVTCTMGTGGCFVGREANNSPPLWAEDKNGGAIRLLSHKSSWSSD